MGKWTVVAVAAILSTEAFAFNEPIALKLDCAEKGPWTFDVRQMAVGDVEEYEVRMSAPKESAPPQFDVSFTCPPRGAHNVWVPILESSERHRLFATEWGGVRYKSEIALCEPLCAAFGEDETNSLTIACSEAFRHVDYAITVHSTDARLEGRFRFFSVPEAPISKYAVRIRIDRRRVFWSEAVSANSQWIAKASGNEPCRVPDAAFEPTYSSWYAFWQDVHDADVEKEAEIAASLGMTTAILDDGWQKEKSKGTYSATGDWMPARSRFPDFRAHVDRVHAAGISNYLVWLSVPYVGNESKAYERFRGKFLRRGNPSVQKFDPRFPEVREYLVATYERCLRDWDLDGLKLDFIDLLHSDADDPARDDGYAGRDCRTVEEGVDRLMTAVHERLTAIKPEALIEFRQRYTGPAIRRYGNMLRATDCPYDILGNRKRIVDLRLTSGRTAVHSDMLVWSPEDTPEAAARVILNAIFGTVQYSMRLTKTPSVHLDLIRHWIRFARRHRDALLKGSIRPHHPELMYPLVEAESDVERIVAVYDPNQAVRPGTDGKPVVLVNATTAGSLTVDSSLPRRATVFDTFGRETGVTTLPAGLSRLAIPESGYAELEVDEDAAAYARIESEVARAESEIAVLQKALADRCCILDYSNRVTTAGGRRIWTDALQRALDEHEVVVIPPAEEPYLIDRPVLIGSHRRIEAYGATVRLADGVTTLMLRTAAARDGTLAPVGMENRNDNIAIVGGTWEDNGTDRRGYGRSGMFNLEERKVGNAFGVSTLFYLGCANHVTVRDVVFRRCGAFAVQSGDGDAHVYENILFDRCYADGLHLNGNLTRVKARNVRGNVGDDLVALNAYDWLNSSVNFGPQRFVLCEDLELRPRQDGRKHYPAIRIQPACYRYADGSVVDCAVSDVIFRRVKGIETFKSYLQTPRYEIGTSPEWSRVGSGGNLFFEDIAIDLTQPIDCIDQYKSSDPVRGHFGAFEFGANLSSVTLRNIDITFHADRWPRTHLATVGPKSAFRVVDGKGVEIFDPYVTSRIGKLTVENLTVRGAAPEELVHVTEFADVNRDGHSSGKGEIGKLCANR